MSEQPHGDPTPAAPPEPPPAAPNGQLDLDTLAEPVRKQIEELRGEAVRARRELRAAQQVADQERAEKERLRLEHESEQEKAIRQAVETARGEESAKWAGRLLEAQVTARAAGRLRDPSDAPKYLQLEALLDEPDEKIDEALDALLEEKPYLALEGSGLGAAPAGSTGLVTQGARSGSPPAGLHEGGSADSWIRGRRRK